MNERIIKQAEEVIENAMSQSLNEAYTRLNKERFGKGCGCMNVKEWQLRR